jgi:hypothetical protein
MSQDCGLKTEVRGNNTRCFGDATVQGHCYRTRRIVQHYSNFRNSGCSWLVEEENDVKKMVDGEEIMENTDRKYFLLSDFNYQPILFRWEPEKISLQLLRRNDVSDFSPSFCPGVHNGVAFISP